MTLVHILYLRALRSLCKHKYFLSAFVCVSCNDICLPLPRAQFMFCDITCIRSITNVTWQRRQISLTSVAFPTFKQHDSVQHTIQSTRGQAACKCARPAKQRVKQAWHYILSSRLEIFVNHDYGQLSLSQHQSYGYFTAVTSKCLKAFSSSVLDYFLLHIFNLPLGACPMCTQRYNTMATPVESLYY